MQKSAKTNVWTRAIGCAAALATPARLRVMTLCLIASCLPAAGAGGCATGSGQQGRDDSARALAGLRAESPLARRSAALYLAASREHSKEVIDAVVQDEQTEAFLALRLYGRSCLPALYAHLRDSQQRDRTILAIAMFPDPGPAAQRALEDFLRTPGADGQLNYLLHLLSAAASPNGRNTGELRQLAAQARDMSRELPTLYVLWVSLEATHEQGMELLRSRLREIIREIRSGNEAKDLGAVLVATAVAARRGQLAATDLELAGDVAAALRDHDIDSLDPLLRPLPWLQNRNDRAAASALHVLGDETFNNPRFQWTWIHVLGDYVLTPEDVSILTGIARNERFSVEVRRGALRLLSYVGSVDTKAQEAVKEMFAVEALRLEAARCLSSMVDLDGSLVRFARQQLERESSFDLKSTLTESIKLLEGP